MTTSWCPENISCLLQETFTTTDHSHSHSSSTSSLTWKRAAIDVLITFDARGVSSHPNHIFLYHGARAFVSAPARETPGLPPPVDLYTLTTVNMVRKSIGVFDLFATLGAAAAAALKCWASTTNKRRWLRVDKPPPSCCCRKVSGADGGRRRYRP